MGRFRRRPTFGDVMYEGFKDLFVAAAITCFLLAGHRIAAALKTSARIEALEELGDVFTAEEREVVIHKVKSRVISSM